MSKLIQIILTEDQKIFRQGLIPLLKMERIETIGEASNGIELFYLLDVKRIIPDIILLDLQMPEMDGNVTLKILKEKYPKIKIIILSSFNDPTLLKDFKAKGINSYLTKNADFVDIVETIRNVYCLEGYNNISSPKSRFTDGEIQIIPLLLAGKTSKQIGLALGIAEKTVEAYRKKLYAKSKTNNASEFSSYCTREGLEFLGQPAKGQRKSA